MNFAEAAAMMDTVHDNTEENTGHSNIMINSLDGMLSSCRAVLDAARDTGHAQHVEDCIGALEVAKDGVQDAAERLVVAGLKAIDAAAGLRGSG